MRKSYCSIWLSVWSCVLLGSVVVGCGPVIKVIPASSSSSVTPPPSEKMKVIVLRLENTTRKGKADASTGEDRLFGNGMRAQLVKALEQTERFTIVSNSGPREVVQRGTLTSTGEISGRVKERLGSLGDAELIVAGALTTYQLSKESKNAGVDADLLFRETQARVVALDGIVDTAKKVFGSVRSAGLDQVALELWLFDAKTGKRIASTMIEGIPSDSGETIGGLFGQKLAAATSETATPMQRALRGGAIKAANWIADTNAAFRAGTLSPPAVVEKKKTPEFEREPRRAIETPPPTIVKPTRAERKTSASSRTTEQSAPEAAPSSATEEDWGSPSGSPSGRTEKVPAQKPEEWGEQ